MRRAKWRHDPATDGQKKFVESRLNKAPKYAQKAAESGTSRSLRIQRLTKGEAANIITRIKHGAMVSMQFYYSCFVKLTHRFFRVDMRIK